jgi:hypothetical protein
MKRYPAPKAIEITAESMERTENGWKETVMRRHRHEQRQ